MAEAYCDPLLYVSNSPEFIRKSFDGQSNTSKTDYTSMSVLIMDSVSLIMVSLSSKI